MMKTAKIVLRPTAFSGQVEPVFSWFSFFIWDMHSQQSTQLAGSKHSPRPPPKNAVPGLSLLEIVTVMHIFYNKSQRGVEEVGTRLWTGSILLPVPQMDLSAVWQTSHICATQRLRSKLSRRKLSRHSLQRVPVAGSSLSASLECVESVCVSVFVGQWSVTSSYYPSLKLCETPDLLYQPSAGWKIQKSLFIWDLAPTGWRFWLSSQGHPRFEVGICFPTVWVYFRGQTREINQP